MLRVVFVVVVMAAVVWAVAKNREAFVLTLRGVGPLGVAISLLCGLISVLASGSQWRAIVGGVGLMLSWTEALRIFLVSQVGKYLPGSVWPIVVQMEAGRQRGVNRKTMISANMITLAIALATGLVIVGVTLPFSSVGALSRFWWALAATPLVVVLALPRSLPYLIDKALLLLRRQPLGIQVPPRATLVAAGWGAVAWVALGLHLMVLVAAVNGFSWGLLALCIGGMALAVTAGILFIPAPAGAGLREVVLGAVLSVVLSPGQAVAVVVASRVILLLADVLGAGLGLLVERVARSDSAPAS